MCTLEVRILYDYESWLESDFNIESWVVKLWKVFCYVDVCFESFFKFYVYSIIMGFMWNQNKLNRFVLKSRN